MKIKRRRMNTRQRRSNTLPCYSEGPPALGLLQGARLGQFADLLLRLAEELWQEEEAE